MTSGIGRNRNASRIAIVAASVLALIGRAGAAERPNGDLEWLKELWKKQSTEIKTAKFEVVLFRYFDPTAKLLSREEAVKRLDSVGQHATTATIEPLFDDVAGRGWEKKKSSLWGTTVDVLVDGSKIANTYSKARGRDIRIYDGVDVVSYRAANKQASIESGLSRISQIDLDTLRLNIFPLIDWADAPLLEPSKDGQAILRSQGITVRFDPKSGFMHQFTRSAEGKTSEEILQYQPGEMNGVTLAKVVAELNIEDDHVRMMSVYMIKPLSVNAKLPDESFRLAIPANTLVVDYTINPKSPTIVTVTESLPDVKLYKIFVPPKP